MPTYNYSYQNEPMGGLGGLARQLMLGGGANNRLLGLRAQNIGGRNLVNQLSAQQKQFDLRTGKEDRVRTDMVIRELAEKARLDPTGPYAQLYRGYLADKANPKNYSEGITAGLESTGRRDLFNTYPLNPDPVEGMKTEPGRMGIALRGPDTADNTIKALTGNYKQGLHRKAHDKLQGVTLNQLQDQPITDLQDLGIKAAEMLVPSKIKVSEAKVGHLDEKNKKIQNDIRLKGNLNSAQIAHLEQQDMKIKAEILGIAYSSYLDDIKVNAQIDKLKAQTKGIEQETGFKKTLHKWDIKTSRAKLNKINVDKNAIVAKMEIAKLKGGQEYENLKQQFKNLEQKERKLVVETDIKELELKLNKDTFDSDVAFAKARGDLKTFELTQKKGEIKADILPGSLKVRPDGTMEAVSATTGQQFKLTMTKGFDPMARDQKIIDVTDEDGNVIEKMVVSPSTMANARRKLNNMDKALSPAVMDRGNAGTEDADGFVVGTRNVVLSKNEKKKATIDLQKTNNLHEILMKSMKLIRQHPNEIIGMLGKFNTFAEFFNNFDNVYFAEDKNGNFVPFNKDTQKQIEDPATQFSFYVNMLRAQARQMLIGEKRVSDSEQKLVNEIVDGQMLFKNPTEAMHALSAVAQINEGYRMALSDALNKDYEPRNIPQVVFSNADQQAIQPIKDYQFKEIEDYPGESDRPEVMSVMGALEAKFGDKFELHIDDATGTYFYFDSNGTARTVIDKKGNPLTVLK